MENLTKLIIFILGCSFSVTAHSQTFSDDYNRFRQSSQEKFSSFRSACNQKYANFLREAWVRFECKAPEPKPKEDNTVPPRPYDGRKDSVKISISPVDDVPPVIITPQPKPIEPIREVPVADDDYFCFEFYGLPCKVRLSKTARTDLNDCGPKSIAAAWEKLSGGEMDNAIRDCLETRLRYNLCDWAYLMFLNTLGKEYCTNPDSAALLTAFLYCQSGYQMRLATDSGRLLMLYGTKHNIYDKSYYIVAGTKYYPLGEPTKSISICNAAFEGETPMSLIISSEQLLGPELTGERKIKSTRYADVSAIAQTPSHLIEFFNSYPTSAIGSNSLSRWAMYANTPLAATTAAQLYPALKQAITGCTELEAANKLLNWVQTGFEYEYDDKVWGHDRAFFAEETLYYPYCDCEDRSILFSRLVRDLMGLDVALIYYPGHLATAVCFKEDIHGDEIKIGNRRFIVCDPTYIGAPVGAQMPGLDYSATKAILLDAASGAAGMGGEL